MVLAHLPPYPSQRPRTHLLGDGERVVADEGRERRKAMIDRNNHFFLFAGKFEGLRNAALVEGKFSKSLWQLGKQKFINKTVKSARKFDPGKRLHGVTVYQLCMTLLESMLMVHSRKTGGLDTDRLRSLVEARTHFDEHVMFRHYSTAVGEEAFTQMNRDYERLTAHLFRRQYEEFAAGIGRELPELARTLILQHLAFFQRIDVVLSDEAQRVADLRDAHGLLFGSVTPENIQEILQDSAGFART